MKPAAHSKFINKIAKQSFNPFGIIQKGQSRIWLDDQGWFTTIIEFQPFLGEKGTTLNIGVNFHWYNKDYFSFDIGGRLDVDFVNYDENKIENFTNKIHEFCEISLHKVMEYRTKLQTIYTAKEHILKHSFPSEEFWGSYSKGVICGLTNDFNQQNNYFEKLLNAIHPVEWVEKLKEETKNLKLKSSNNEMFTDAILEIILETRKSKKLPEMEISFNNQN